MIIIKCFWISSCDILFSLKLLLANDMHLTPVCKSTVSLGKKKKKKYSLLCHQTSPCNFQGSMAPCGLWSTVLDALFKPTKEVKDVFTVVSVNWVSPLVSAIFTPVSYIHTLELQTCPDCYCNSLIRPGTQCYLSDGWREMRRKGSQKIFKGLDGNVKNLEHV